MTEEFKIVRAERTQARLRLALQGSSGGGKTATSLLIAKGMVEALRARGALPTHLDPNGAFIGLLDTERDSAKLYSHLVKFDTLVLEPPYSPKRFSAALRALEKVGYPIIICDQITHEWYGQGGVLSMVANSRESNDFAKWNGPSQDHEQFMDDLLHSYAHLIVTMRSKTAWVLEDKVGRDGKVRKTPTRIGMAAKQREGTEYEFTTLLDLEVETNAATCLKDRTELFTIGEKIPRMTPEWGKRLIDWVYSAEKPEPAKGPETTPAERADAMLHAAVRLFERCQTVPDLASAFVDAQRGLREMSVEAGKEVISPLLERLVNAKDARKKAFGPDASPAPPAEGFISADDCALLELFLEEAKVQAADLKAAMGVARLSLLPVVRLKEAQAWVLSASPMLEAHAALAAKYWKPHIPERAPEQPLATAVDKLNGLVREVIATRDAESPTRSFFEGMEDDIPFEPSAAAGARP